MQKVSSKISQVSALLQKVVLETVDRAYKKKYPNEAGTQKRREKVTLPFWFLAATFVGSTFINQESTGSEIMRL